MHRQITHSDPHNLETPWRPGINPVFPLPIFINQADPERFKIIDDEFQSVISKLSLIHI